MKILYSMHRSIYTISIIISASTNYCERGSKSNGPHSARPGIQPMIHIKKRDFSPIIIKFIKI